ncbi:MAG: hypothetical protein Q7T20_07130 [Saprospiraceae bacterium]|nr:hypothetical protein [Saprospiraceae bacterium]
MTAALQLSQVIGQLTPENTAMLEAYAEFLLLRQHEHDTQIDSKKVPITKPDRLNTASKFKGKANFPKISTVKSEVYEQ